MACTHERIKSVNCVLFCDICGAELPAGWFTDHSAPEAAEPAKEPQETKPKKAPTATKTRTTKKGGK